MATLTWNDVKVLNPTTNLYEAYLFRTKLYTPGTTVFCTNGTGWEQCSFIANPSFNSGEIFDGITPLVGQYFRCNTPQASGPDNPMCLMITKVIDEVEFNSGQMQCPSGYSGFGCPSGPCSVDYDTLSQYDLSSLALFIHGLPTLDFITYCCKKGTSYSPLSLSMVCVGGCTDPLALNYDSTQLIDDGSCMYNGCMDILAANYNPQAVFDDGSCLYAGCTDQLASNYDPNASFDDGSCDCQKCCESVDVLGNVSHMTLNSTTSPCQCPSGWYDVICGQFLGWECDPTTTTCALVPNGAYSSQTECNEDCGDCGCTKLLGTGNTSAYSIALSADCEEYCCDPDLDFCEVLVVGDNEGIQMYNPITNNTTHLFDSNYADVLDIAAAHSGNNGFIWVYKNTGGGATILEYGITMVPFTQTLVRTLNVGTTFIGRGLTYFGTSSSGDVVLTAGAGTGSIQNYTLPVGVVNTTFSTTFVYSLPTGYKITGDLLTQGRAVLNCLDVVLYDNGSTYKVGVISRNTGTVLDEHIISSAIMTGTTKMEGLFVDTNTFPGVIKGVTTDGRVYELLQNAGGIVPGLQFSPTPSGQIDFINNITNTVYGADNISFYNRLCAESAIQMPDSFDCIVSQGGCTDPGTGMGAYSSLAQCQQFCIVTWNCNPGSIAGNCKTNVIINNYFVENEKTALQWISLLITGMQGMNFNTISWPNITNPSTTIPGICRIKNGYPPNVTIEQQWKIKYITCKQIHPTAYFYTWKSFVVYAASVTGNGGLFNSTCTYDIAQAWLYGTYGYMQTNQIKIYSEPCICWNNKCRCYPLFGPSGTYLSEISCEQGGSSGVPCCPCKKCCRKNTPPYNTISLLTTTYPCKCPPGYNTAICQVPWPQNPVLQALVLPEPKEITLCEKTCTNGSYYIPLEIDDEHCDCNTYGLDEAPTECDKCCTDGKKTKQLALYSTVCECDSGWYECETTPECDKLCVSTAKETTKRLLRPEWPNCNCPVGYKVYVESVGPTVVITSSNSINCSKCNGGEPMTRTFGSELCPEGWTLSSDFIVSTCSGITPVIEPPTLTPVIEQPVTVDEEVPKDLVLVDSLKLSYDCTSSVNNLVGEKQMSCVPSEKGKFKTIEACLSSGCGGFMSCDEGMAIDGVKFNGKSYTPIVMCCESVINTSVDKLTQTYCNNKCNGKNDDTWYPLYNAFGPNTMYQSLLSYMVRELLEPVRNKECEVGAESTFTQKGYYRQ